MSSRQDEASTGSDAPKRGVGPFQERADLLFVTLTSIGDAVITTDAEGNVTFMNPAAEKLTGWSLLDAVGLSTDEVVQIVDEATGEAVPSPVHEVLRGSENVKLPEDAVLLKRDGTRVYIADTARPIIGFEGSLLGVVLAFTDVTERKTSEATIKWRSALDRLATRIATMFTTTPVNEMDSALDFALEEIGEFLDADRAFIFLFSRDGSQMKCAHEWSAPEVEPFNCKSIPTSSVFELVDRIRRQEYIRVTNPEEVSGSVGLWVDRNAKSFVAVPMLREDRALGLIGVDSVREAKAWPREIIDTLYLIGSVSASAIERSRAMQKLAAAREREVDIGAKIQQALLLGNPPQSLLNYLVASLTIPSQRIDGDFYDFLQHPNYSLDILFGDVMGKGVPAALLSAGCKTEFLRSLAHLLAVSPGEFIPEPEVIVNSMHSVLTPHLMSLESFVTLSYLRFEPATRKVTLVDCGNTRVLRCKAGDENVDFLAGHNLPLGFSLSEVYSQAEFDYFLGDLFFLYSDGVTEAKNREGEIFGIDRLKDFILENKHLEPHELVDVLKKTVIEFVGSSALTDDFTCVAVRVITDESQQAPVSVGEMATTSSLTDLPAIRRFVKQFCREQDLPLSDKELYMLELAVTEVASNLMRHAYKGDDNRPIWIRMNVSEEALNVRLLHEGEPFESPRSVPLPPLNGSREGGFGLFIISRAVDEVNSGVDDSGRHYIEIIKRIST